MHFEYLVVSVSKKQVTLKTIRNGEVMDGINSATIRKDVDSNEFYTTKESAWKAYIAALEKKVKIEEDNLNNMKKALDAAKNGDILIY